MIIDGKQLSETILSHLKKEIAEGKKKGWKAPCLVIFTVTPTEETKSYLRSKKKQAEAIGAEVRVVTYKELPRYIEFANHVTSEAQNSGVTGVIIQHPLPASLATVSLLDYIPAEKEIEGFKKKPLFEHPIGLAILTMLKAVFSPEDMNDPETALVRLDKDAVFLKSIFKRKRVVLIGKGPTGGGPIGNTLARAKINYINLNSKTPTGDEFISQADVIISAVGKTIIEPALLDRNVVLISVGMHKEDGRWVGDYDDEKIKDSVFAYSPTPGGVGPLNVSYLFANLVDSWKMQNASK